MIQLARRPKDRTDDRRFVGFCNAVYQSRSVKHDCKYDSSIQDTMHYDDRQTPRVVSFILKRPVTPYVHLNQAPQPSTGTFASNKANTFGVVIDHGATEGQGQGQGGKSATNFQ